MNRCTWFCRPMPSRSAIAPAGARRNLILLRRQQTFRRRSPTLIQNSLRAFCGSRRPRRPRWKRLECRGRDPSVVPEPHHRTVWRVAYRRRLLSGCRARASRLRNRWALCGCLTEPSGFEGGAQATQSAVEARPPTRRKARRQGRWTPERKPVGRSNGKPSSG